ncbi:flagellar export chaperone FlgN [Janthinobacterium sp. CG_S6]|uniref:flagellar export chaperone FlgN n=1 Tax=Janthinobacterium sp. CG_S6 TaxID=3071707 RepID=UPI002E031458|nr:flagella synthesis protein FlgN [Janthinobacterium sp. CG_S6]
MTPAPGERRDAMTRLLRGVADDVPAYQALLQLLDEQFDAALRHQSARLATLAEHIGAAVDAIEARRRERVALVATLLGPGGTLAGAAELLRGATRQGLERNWIELEQMVLECKRRNIRTSALLSEQYSIMQRVLNGEEDQIYAPL